MHVRTTAFATAAAASTPEGFSLNAYIDTGAMQFGSGKQIALDAWVSSELADILRETPLSMDQRIIDAENGMCVRR